MKRSTAQVSVLRETEHRHGDDLLSAGLGLPGLQLPLPVVTLETLSAAVLRRRAIHSNWNGIAWLGAPAPCLADALAAPVPGREFHTLLQLPGCRHPHRVMLQLPDDFDPQAPKLLVTASSGSRGIYGAIALAGAWGLPRGWAVAYTDKGCGSDCYDVAAGESPALDGMPSGDPAVQVFRPQSLAGLPAGSVLIKHAHSGDNPEAHWGAALIQTAEFAWQLLDELHGTQAPSRSPRRRTLAVGLSNAGAAVLQAMHGQHRFDGAVVLAPNVYPPRGGRAFFDYLSEAALWMRCAQGDRRLAHAPSPLPPAQVEAQAAAAVADLRTLGLLRDGSFQQACATAYRLLRRRGWPRRTLAAARLSCGFDFWYSAGLAYASAAGAFAPDQHPLRASCHAVDAHGSPHSAGALERALRWSDGTGIVPGAGVAWLTEASRAVTLAGLRGLWCGHDAVATRVRAGVAATRCGLPQAGVPILLLHGADDGLIPPVFSSEPYLRCAQAAGAEIVGWSLPDTPHFDAFLDLPGYGEFCRPLLPQGFAALDAMQRRLDAGLPLPGGAQSGIPRGAD